MIQGSDVMQQQYARGSTREPVETTRRSSWDVKPGEKGLSRVHSFPQYIQCGI
jgi:hypothetical protein